MHHSIVLKLQFTICALARDDSGSWRFGNVARPPLSQPHSVGVQINNWLLGRQRRCAAVQSGSFLWGGLGHQGCGAPCGSCCLRWEYRLALRVVVAVADAWNGTQVAGPASGLRCIFRQVITLPHWFSPPSTDLGRSLESEGEMEGWWGSGQVWREGQGNIDWPSAEIQQFTTEPRVAMLPLSPLICGRNALRLQEQLFRNSTKTEANVFLGKHVGSHWETKQNCRSALTAISMEPHCMF